MMEADEVQYFDGEENSASNIKTLMELAVTTDSRMKKASFKYQDVVLRTMRTACQHHRGNLRNPF